jgi:hypothetical protein
VEHGKNLYAVLRVREDATSTEIRAAYRILIQRYHPDRYEPKAEAEALSREINHAYRILGKANARASYDAELAARREQARYEETERKKERARAEQAAREKREQHAPRSANSTNNTPPPPGSANNPPPGGTASSSTSNQQPASAPSASSGGSSWLLYCIGVALGMKWFGPLFGLIAIPLLIAVWTYLKENSILVRLGAVSGVFVAASFIAAIAGGAFREAMLPSTQDAAFRAAAQAAAGQQRAPKLDIVDPYDQATRTEIVDPWAPGKVMEDAAAMISDPLDRNAVQMSDEEWQQTAIRYWNEHHLVGATGSKEFLELWAGYLKTIRARDPSLTARQLLESASRAAQLDYDARQAGIKRIHQQQAVANSYEEPQIDLLTMTSDDPRMASLSAEDQLKVYQRESEARLAKFDNERTPASSSESNPPSESVEQGSVFAPPKDLRWQGRPIPVSPSPLSGK